MSIRAGAKRPIRRWNAAEGSHPARASPDTYPTSPSGSMTKRFQSTFRSQAHRRLCTKAWPCVGQSARRMPLIRFHDSQARRTVLSRDRGRRAPRRRGHGRRRFACVARSAAHSPENVFSGGFVAPQDPQTTARGGALSAEASCPEDCAPMRLVAPARVREGSRASSLVSR